MIKYINLCAVLILVGVAACSGNDDSESSIIGETKTEEGDGRVICYNDDGTEFFNHVGAYVDTYQSGFIVFRHLKSHPDYDKGTIKFSPRWKCIVEDW